MAQYPAMGDRRVAISPALAPPPDRSAPVFLGAVMKRLWPARSRTRLFAIDRSVMTAIHPTIADALPGASTRARALFFVLSGALLTAIAAQISFHLPWTPVPITGQTFAVLVIGAGLGARRGAASQMLYITLGAIGLPFYADGDGGWSAATGPTAGYLVGFVVAAAAVGWLAERRQDRNLALSVHAMLAGSAIIYVFGVAWLAHSLKVSTAEAVELGMAPFVIGDFVKLLAAGAILPAAWRLVSDNKP